MQDEPKRPTVLTVMAEHGVGDPVWDRPVGDGCAIDLAALGVTPGLVGRLRAWNAQYEHLAVTGFGWESPKVQAAWERAGLHLAHELQDELWDVEVRYFQVGVSQPKAVRASPGR